MEDEDGIPFASKKIMGDCFKTIIATKS